MSGFDPDDELIQDYLAESREHLATIESDLMAMEQRGAEIDEEIVNRVFRAAHSIKGGAGFFNLTNIRDLAHKTEGVLDRVRSRKLVPAPDVISILLHAFDFLRELLNNLAASNQTEIGEYVAALDRLCCAVPVPVPEPVAPRTPPPESVAAPQAETTLRLNVALLDSLMTLAGELVLSRNQLNESLSRRDERGIRSAAQRVSLVTSDLQEVVTLTRMQPIGNVFAKFPRLVRDLAIELGKDVHLEMEGAEVEIDKTILEGLSDPLTHMVRNAVDHGIESRARRLAAGKPAEGTLTLRAHHQAGQIVLEVSDDGKGLDRDKLVSAALAKGLVTKEQTQRMPEAEMLGLIFLPGVSTADQVSDISGRGVGMDVVRTNLEKLGGKIEIHSQPGRGTEFRIKLPLTLAIIPSLLVSQGGERFAIPQANVSELIRIRAHQIAARTDRIGSAEVLTVRDRLVPLVHLADILETSRPDYTRQAMNVVLANTGTFEYGLVVEELHDTVEIVVKPLGRHLKAIPCYAGATILGDGRVAVILDVTGVAAGAGLSHAAAKAIAGHRGQTGISDAGELYSLLLFENARGEQCAVPIELVARVERIRAGQIEMLGGRRTLQYRGASLPVVTLADVAGVRSLEASQSWVVIVFERSGRAVGLLAAEPLDTVESRIRIDRATLRQPGVEGSVVLKGRTTLLVDVFELAASVIPGWQEAERRPAAARGKNADAERPKVLLAEDSDFFRGQIQRLIEAVGFSVIAAADGEQAWDLLNRHGDEIRLLTTDIEMPRLDGLSLTRRIRSDERFRTLPIIALSSLAGDDDISRGLEAGVDEYQVKLNPEELMQSIRRTARRGDVPAGGQEEFGPEEER